MSKKRTDTSRKSSGAGRPTPSGVNGKNDDKSVKNANAGRNKGKKPGTFGMPQKKPADGKISAQEEKKKTGAKESEREKNLKNDPNKKSPGARKIYKERTRKKGRRGDSADGDRNYGDAFNNSEMLDVENVFEKEQPESRLHYMKPLPKAKAPNSPLKRMLKRLLFYAVTVLVLVSVCFVLSITVFFKIDEIMVEGDTRYPAEDIISSCKIETGDNLILCNTSPGEAEIWKKFPYIESVNIRKKLFNKIVIEVQEAVPSSLIESDGKYVLLSESGKIIDISDKKQGDVPIIMGAKLMTPKLSSSVKYKDPKVEEYISDILAAAEEYKFGVLKVIDISNLSKITVETKKGLHIIIGTPENVDYKLKTAKKIIDKDIPADDIGTLDVSLSSVDGGKSYFSSKKAPEASKPQASETSKSGQTSGEQPLQSSQASEQSVQESTQEHSDPLTSDQESSSEETSPDDTSQEETSEDISDYTPDYTPDDEPDDTSDYTPDDEPDYTPDYTPDDEPDDTPDYTPDDEPDDTPDYTPDDEPDDTPDYTPDDEPDDTSDDVSE
ncbi:MAG: FtsQ-type POTRA domain-containing protein [Clostridia bacterium]|nr:FtsQ-type POTRA domain-containing protein [Clostridia bacterium]